MKLLKKLKNNIKSTISKPTFGMEMVFFIGLFIIIFTNFKLNFYFGMYFLGVILIAYSVFLFKFTPKRGDKR